VHGRAQTFVVSAEQRRARVFPQAPDDLDSLVPHGLDELVVCRVDAARELEILPY
jgi:hypothetical protein